MAASILAKGHQDLKLEDLRCTQSRKRMSVSTVGLCLVFPQIGTPCLRPSVDKEPQPSRHPVTRHSADRYSFESHSLGP